jgi:hypothetical protein
MSASSSPGHCDDCSDKKSCCQIPRTAVVLHDVTTASHPAPFVGTPRTKCEVRDATVPPGGERPQKLATGPGHHMRVQARVCRSPGYGRGCARRYLNDLRRNWTEIRKCSHQMTRRCTIISMKYVYADSCRAHRPSESLKGLLTSRGRGMAQILKAQSFNWVATDHREVPSTA